MNVQPINNNNYSFKRLKIDPYIAKTLENQSSEYLKHLEQVGERLKPIKRFHLYLINDLQPQIYAENLDKYSGKDFFKELKERIMPLFEKPNTIENESLKDYPNLPEIFQKIFGKNAENTYNEFKNLDELEQAARYCDILDKNAMIDEMHEQMLKQQETENFLKEKRQLRKQKEQVNNILEKCGMYAKHDKPAKSKFNLFDRFIKYWLDL